MKITNWFRKRLPNEFVRVVAEPAPDAVQEAVPEAASESSATIPAPPEGAQAAAPDLHNLLQPGCEARSSKLVEAIVSALTPPTADDSEERTGPLLDDMRIDIKPRTGDEIQFLLTIETEEQTLRRIENDRMRIEYARFSR